MPPPNPHLTRLLARLPPGLHRYTSTLRTAPLSHLTAFLILHELTAVAPLVGLAATFHYTNTLPQGGQWLGENVRAGAERFGRWFGRKGWFGFEAGAGAGAGAQGSLEGVERGGGEGGRGGGGGGGGFSGGEDGMLEKKKEVEGKGKVYSSSSEQGTKILVEVATAYAITKVLLPVRVAVSVWATPWFARVFVGRLGRVFALGRRVFGRGGGKVAAGGGGRNTSPAAGTGAVGGGVGSGSRRRRVG
ncbi:hypothetical protein LZ554_008642 [Drepanopeziza brunnea f. sp. 'monogermtubi']|nr:hypothetical protein LZ554_008642 [Drepanopeziza brunnea f. sp. 'monogermtubi']